MNDINKLKAFVMQSKLRLQQLLETMQWTEANVLQNFHGNKSAASAVQTQSKPELPLPTSYVNTNSIQIDLEKLRELTHNPVAEIPRTFSDIQTNFTREQKLQIYQHVIENTQKCNQPATFVPALQDGQTFADIVSQQKRENKRKRRHRTSKPTQIEAIRSLIELQMHAYQTYVAQKQKEDNAALAERVDSRRSIHSKKKKHRSHRHSPKRKHHHKKTHKK